MTYWERKGGKNGKPQLRPHVQCTNMGAWPRNSGLPSHAGPRVSDIKSVSAVSELLFRSGATADGLVSGSQVLALHTQQGLTVECKGWQRAVFLGNRLAQHQAGAVCLAQTQAWPFSFQNIKPATHIQHRRKSFCTRCHTSPSMGQSVHSTSPVADAGTGHQRERARQETGTVSGPRVSLYYTLHFLIQNLSQSKSFF